MAVRQPRVAIVGASVRAAAQSALRAGWNVVAADRFADADLVAAVGDRNVANIHMTLATLQQWLAAARAEAWMFTSTLENHPDWVEELAAICPLWGCGRDALEAARSPVRLAAITDRVGCRFPETIASPEGIPADGVWLCKPAASGGGVGITAWRSVDAAKSPPLPRDYVWQRRVSGMPASALFVGDGRRAMLLAVTRQLVGEAWCGATGFLYCGMIVDLGDSVPADAGGGASGIVHGVDRRLIAALGDELASQCELRGLFGVDLIIDGADAPPWVIEVNPRYTAACEPLERIVGRPLVELHAAACQGETLPAGSASVAVRANRDFAAAGKAIAYAQHDAIIDGTIAAQWLAEAHAGRLADIPYAGTRIGRGEPVLTILADGSSAAVVRRQLQRRMEATQRQLLTLAPLGHVEPR